jgi:hypothetical protein
MRIKSFLAALALVALVVSSAHAAPLMPDFSTVPSGWFTDRYNPDSFSNVGTVAGRSNVLGIGIGSNGAVANRPLGQQSQFYDTQGMGYSISGAAGDSLSAGLYIPSSWGSAANGAVRTDMWGVMNNGTLNNITDYPIIGFTNYKGGTDAFVGFQVWDDNLASGNGAWVELATPVKYGAWNDLSIDFTGTDFLYFVNGTQVYDETNLNGSANYQEVIMQGYNFNDPVNFPNANAAAYTADWSNTPASVPEPSSLLLLAGGLGFVGFMSMRGRRAAMPAPN